MELPTEQSNGPHPIIQLSGYLFQKVTVDSVQSVNGTVYETLFIAAYKNSEWIFIDSLAKKLPKIIWLCFAKEPIMFSPSRTGLYKVFGLLSCVVCSVSYLLL